ALVTAQGRLHGLLSPYSFGTRMNAQNIGLSTLVQIDLKILAGEGLPFLQPTMLVREQPQQAQVKRTLNGLQAATTIITLEAGAAIAHGHDIVDIGLAGRQACQSHAGLALH